jgi:hypothetical protein
VLVVVLVLVAVLVVVVVVVSRHAVYFSAERPTRQYPAHDGWLNIHLWRVFRVVS